MANTPQRPKLVVIVGPTASGKSDLAMKVAQEFDGEIIAADSRTVYLSMDIGTGKPTFKEQNLVPHHLIDIKELNEFFSVSDFKKLADKTIKDIVKRGKLPVLVGGSGMFVDSVLFNFEFLPPPPPEMRRMFNAMSVNELQDKLRRSHINLPLNYRNKRHLIRTLETKGAKPKKTGIMPGTLVIGLNPGVDELKKKISVRVKKMIAAGLEEEVRFLARKYSRDARSLEAIGYQEWQNYFDGKASLQDVENSIVQNSLNYAKRQKTWFKRNKFIHWFDFPEQAYDYIRTTLNT